MSTAPWRDDPDLAGSFHPEFPDDLQVVVHDGEPRRTKRAPEVCWVRVGSVHATLRFPVAPADAELPIRGETARWIERRVYRGALLNQPHHLVETSKGGEVLVVGSPGLPHPLQIRAAYLAERTQWALT